jgi:hypothetical protein
LQALLPRAAVVMRQFGSTHYSKVIHFFVIYVERLRSQENPAHKVLSQYFSWSASQKFIELAHCSLSRMTKV